MAWNTKEILKSFNLPVPQFHDVTNDIYKVLTGAELGNGRNGSDSIMWGMTAGGVYVRQRVDANGQSQIGIPDGSDVTKGAKADTAITDPASTTATQMALLKGLIKQLQGTGTGSQPVAQVGPYVEKTGLTAVNIASGVTTTMFTIINADTTPWKEVAFSVYQPEGNPNFEMYMAPGFWEGQDNTTGYFSNIRVDDGTHIASSLNHVRMTMKFPISSHAYKFLIKNTDAQALNFRATLYRFR